MYLLIREDSRTVAVMGVDESVRIPVARKAQRLSVNPTGSAGE